MFPRVDNIPALVHKTAWHWPGIIWTTDGKSADAYITRPQWVNKTHIFINCYKNGYQICFVTINRITKLVLDSLSYNMRARGTTWLRWPVMFPRLCSSNKYGNQTCWHFRNISLNENIEFWYILTESSWSVDQKLITKSFAGYCIESTVTELCDIRQQQGQSDLQLIFLSISNLSSVTHLVFIIHLLFCWNNLESRVQHIDGLA